MKILLMCANGLSTGILMNKMNQWAEQNNEDLEVKAIPIDDYLSVYKDYALGNVENIIKEVKRMIKEGK